jgi:hypothetical protein
MSPCHHPLHPPPEKHPCQHVTHRSASCTPSPSPTPPLATPAVPTAPSGEGPLLADYREHSTDVSVHFDLELVAGKMAACSSAAGGLMTKFKLASRISTGVCQGCVLTQ